MRKQPCYGLGWGLSAALLPTLSPAAHVGLSAVRLLKRQAAAISHLSGPPVGAALTLVLIALILVFRRIGTARAHPESGSAFWPPSLIGQDFC